MIKTFCDICEGQKRTSSKDVIEVMISGTMHFLYAVPPHAINYHNVDEEIEAKYAAWICSKACLIKALREE